MGKIEEFLAKYCVFSLEMHEEHTPYSYDEDEYELRLSAKGFRKLVADTEFATAADGFKLVDAPTSEKVAVVIVDLTSIDTKSVVDLHQYVSKSLGGVPCVVMPREADLITMSAKELKGIRERIDDYIKASEFDSFVELSERGKNEDRTG